MTSITFIRHGESEANANPSIRFEATYNEDDVPLSARGREQAAACYTSTLTGNTLVWSSPMTRALQTTKIILTGTEKQFIVDPRLREMKWPIFATMDEKSLHKANTKQYGMYHYKGEGFESGEEVARRLRVFLQENMAAMAGYHNIIVSHEIVMRAFMFLQSRDPTVFDTLEFKNCESLHWMGWITELLTEK